GPASRPAPRTVEVDIRNVDFHATDTVTLHIRSLRGRFVGKAGVPNFDDPTSYDVEVDAGEIAIDEGSLNALLGESLAGHSKPPMKHMQLDADDGLLK